MQQYSFLSADTIISTAKAEAIGSTTSSLTALQDVMMIERLNGIIQLFTEEGHKRMSLGGFSWMKKTYLFNTFASTTLDGAVSAGASTYTLTSASSFPSSGRNAIKNSNNTLDIVDHSSKSTHTLTVSTSTNAETIDIAHSNLEAVHALYPIPSNFGRLQYLTVNNIPYTLVDYDGFPYGTEYSFVGGYILFAENIGVKDVSMTYFRKPTTIADIADITDVPSVHSRYVIEQLKAYIYGVRRKRNDLATALAQAEQALLSTVMYETTPLAFSQDTRIPLPY